MSQDVRGWGGRELEGVEKEVMRDIRKENDEGYSEKEMKMTRVTYPPVPWTDESM